MKIGFDAKRAFTNNTGLGNYSRDTIHILSHQSTDNKYFLYTPINNDNNRISSFARRKNIIICTPKNLFNKAVKAYWRSRGILKDLESNRINIYHGLSNELPINIEKTSIKTVVTIHDLIFIRYPELFGTIDRKIYHQKFMSACERADKIIAVSKQTKKDIIDYFNIPAEKINVVYQGCNQIFKKKISVESNNVIITKYNLPKKYLLYVGTIEERKNLITILQVLTELPAQKLVVIGEGTSYKEQCLKFIDKNKISDRVIFLKSLSLEEMASVYQLADIMIYPSIFEGFGIPILEALFSKTPVITSKGGCFSEAGGKHSRYIDPLSISEMKEAITEIQGSKEIRNKMKIEGLKYAQRFTDDKIAKKLIRIYNNLK